MAEGIIKKLMTAWNGAVIPTYQSNSILRLFPSDLIGGEDIVNWATQVIKDQADAKLDLANADWSAGADKLNMDSLELKVYRVSKRLTMNRAEYKLFTRTGALPLGLRDAGSKQGQKASYYFCRGPATGDDVPSTQYNYMRYAGAHTAAAPDMITQAGGKWLIAPNAMKDIGNLAGQMEVRGYNPSTSVVLLPKIAAPILRWPIAVTSTTGFQSQTVRQLIEAQGFLGIELVDDAWLYTLAGANPTQGLFDMYAVDLSQVRVGYTVPEMSEVIKDDVNKRYVFDFQVNFCPLFIPRYFSSTTYWYKGVSRISAIDTTSTS